MSKASITSTHKGVGGRDKGLHFRMKKEAQR